MHNARHTDCYSAYLFLPARSHVERFLERAPLDRWHLNEYHIRQGYHCNPFEINTLATRQWKIRLLYPLREISKSFSSVSAMRASTSSGGRLKLSMANAYTETQWMLICKQASSTWECLTSDQCCTRKATYPAQGVKTCNMALLSFPILTTCIASIAIHDKGYMLRNWPSSEDTKQAFECPGKNFLVNPADNHYQASSVGITASDVYSFPLVAYDTLHINRQTYLIWFVKHDGWSCIAEDRLVCNIWHRDTYSHMLKYFLLILAHTCGSIIFRAGSASFLLHLSPECIKIFLVSAHRLSSNPRSWAQSKNILPGSVRSTSLLLTWLMILICWHRTIPTKYNAVPRDCRSMPSIGLFLLFCIRRCS